MQIRNPQCAQSRVRGKDTLIQQIFGFFLLTYLIHTLAPGTKDFRCRPGTDSGDPLTRSLAQLVLSPLVHSMKFFGKKSTKKSSPADDDYDHNYNYSYNLDRDADHIHHSESSSPTKPSSVPPPPPPKSPPKPASGSTSPIKKPAHPASPAAPTTTSGESRRSSSTRHLSRTSSDLGKQSSFRRKKVDTNTHPLNLPPEEIRRLSRLSAMSARESVDRMDVDPPSSAATPSSPPQRQTTPPAAAAAAPAAQKAGGSQTPPATNGSSSPKGDDAPAPPPHKTDPNSPPPTPADEAEIFKNFGNKFFKEKDYRRAIEEYSKGGLVTYRDSGKALC